jgi:hypothetical protein
MHVVLKIRTVPRGIADAAKKSLLNVPCAFKLAAAGTVA